MAERYTDFAVKLHTLTAQAGGAVFIDSITDASINSRLNVGLARGDGQVFSDFGSLISGAPAASFSTLDLKGLLDAAGLTGLFVDADGTHPGVQLYFRKYAEGGTRVADATAEHIEWTFANGILVPRSLSMTHQGQAQIAVEVIGRQKGATDPLSVDETAQLPAAGAVVDASGLRRGKRLGLDPASYLERHDAYSYFDRTGGLFRTGPTHTNVMDLRVVLVQPRPR